MSRPNTLVPTSLRLGGMACRLLLLSVIALACASPSPSDDPAYEVLHEDFGIRVDLDG